MNRKEMENKIEQLLRQCKESFDYFPINHFVIENSEKFEGLRELTFRKAVALGCIEYVQVHAAEIKINDDEEPHSTYLYETDSKDIKEILLAHGAMHSLDDLQSGNFLFAFQKSFGYFITLDDNFQREVFQAYLKQHNLTENDIIQFLGKNKKDNLSSKIYGLDLKKDLQSLCVTLENGKISFYLDGEEQGGREFCKVMESLGWKAKFEGNRLSGIYYIERE